MIQFFIQLFFSPLFKVVDSCWICSTEFSDTFRSLLYMERSKNHEKNISSRVKKFTFLMRFDHINTVSGILRNLIDKFVFKSLSMQENHVPKAF